MDETTKTLEIKEEDNSQEIIIEPLIEPVIVINDEKSSSTLLQRFAGIFYALLAAFLFTTSVFLTKQLKIDLLDALLLRFIVQCLLIYIHMKFIKHYSFYSETNKNEKLILLINVFFATTGFFSFFIGYRYLSLPDLTTIRYTQVIWIAILAAFIYRETPSIPTILAMLLTMIGVFLVAQPKFLFEKIPTKNSQRLIGLFIALYCSIAMSIMVISNKILLSKYKTKHGLILLQYCIVSLIIIIIHIFISYYSRSNPIQEFQNDFFNWKYFSASFICLLQILASELTQKSVRREHPSIFTIVQSSDILFSILLQNLFTSMKSNLLSLFGSILVLTSIIIISISKLINEKKKNKLPINYIYVYI